MLRKLLKHEFRATARVMGPLFGIMLVLSVLSNLSISYLMNTDAFVLNMLGALLVVAFAIGMVGLVVMSIVLMVNRFRTNLMGDEGYVMFTLPVSSHQLVWSKIIVSSVWFIVTGIVECLAAVISVFEMGWVRELFSSHLFREIARAWREVTERYGLNVPAMILETIVLCLIGCAVMCLSFYAAMAVGHSFANHKMALSVLFFFGIQFVIQLVNGILMDIMDRSNLFNWNWDLDGMAGFHFMMGFAIVASLVLGAVYYTITAVALKRRLNLQ